MPKQAIHWLHGKEQMQVSVFDDIKVYNRGYLLIVVFFLRIYHRLLRSFKVRRAKCCDVWRKWLELTWGRGRHSCPDVTVKVMSVCFNGGRGGMQVMTLLLKSAELSNTWAEWNTRTRRRARHSSIWRNSRRRPHEDRPPSQRPFHFLSVFFSDKWT